MALKSTLLMCGAIVAAGDVAGVAMRQHANFPNSYETSSNFSAPTTAPSNAPQDSGLSYGSGQNYGPGPQDDRRADDRRSDDRRDYRGPDDRRQDDRQSRPSSYQQSSQYTPAPSNGPGNEQMVAVTQIDQADRVLPRMPVESTSGERLGAVAQVRMENGHAREVVLDRGTRIQASDLMFSPARSVLIAQAGPGPSSY